MTRSVCGGAVGAKETYIPTGLSSEAGLDLFVLGKKRSWHVFAEGFEKL
jgi:hypothetical protein